MTISVDRRTVNQPQVVDNLTFTEDELIVPKYQNVWLKTIWSMQIPLFLEWNLS